MTIARIACKKLLILIYRVDIKAVESIATASTNNHVLFIANQASVIDFLLLDLFLPFEGPVFVGKQLQKTSWLSPLFMITNCQFLDTDDSDSVAKARKLIASKSCLIFPEQRISTSGRLGKIDKNAADLCRHKNIAIIPVHINGSDQGAVISRLRLNKRKLFPKITITISQPQKLSRVAKSRDTARTQSIICQQLFSMLENVSFAACDYKKHIFISLVEAAHTYGRRTVIVEDSILPEPLNYGRLIMASLILGKKLREQANGQNRMGVLLPSSTGAVITFFALQAWGITPVMLNVSSGFVNLAAAVSTAGISQIVTSRRFITLGHFEELVQRLAEHADIVYLEEVRSTITVKDKIIGIIASRFPLLMQSRHIRDADDEAVILFTSGSEHQPKGVVLSSSNLLANVYQSSIRFALYRDDLILNCLPVFHCFGLTVGTILPLIAGVRLYMYPSPLHYDLIPSIIYQRQVTFFLGTDTFYKGYAHKADNCDFSSLRYAVAGAEKLGESTRRLFSDKFGVRIIEGYGATEASPVISCNNAVYNSNGSVGRLVSGMNYRLEKVEGIGRGSRLLLRGPNIMLGYIDSDNPRRLQKSKKWYDTGDVVTIDDHGFITIVGRRRRFVKVAGEMISLQRLEELVEQAYPDHIHAAIAVESSIRGEDIFLLTNCQHLEKKQLVVKIRQVGESALIIPKKIVYQPEIPLLASGKINYPEVLALIKKT